MTGLLYVLAVIAFGATGILIYYAAWSLPRGAKDRLRGSIRAFAYAVECRCSYRFGSSTDLTELAAKIGAELRLRHRETVRLEIACYLRHIGLSAIPYRIIHKDPSDRSVAEQATFDKHPQIGASMLELIPSLKSVAPVIELQLAWWDGTRTPYLPAQFDIPIEARILAVASAHVEAAAQDSFETAQAIICDGRGTRFDPAVVDAYSEVMELEVGTRRRKGVRSAAG